MAKLAPVVYLLAAQFTLPQCGDHPQRVEGHHQHLQLHHHQEVPGCDQEEQLFLVLLLCDTVVKVIDSF